MIRLKLYRSKWQQLDCKKKENLVQYFLKKSMN